jgi:capsular polysaccharide biosynthesis protein
MELIDYLRMLRRQWLWVVGVPVVLLAVAFAYVTMAPKTYKASTDVYVGCTVFSSTTGSADNAAAESCRTYTFDGITTYAQLVSSPEVTTKVITDLGLATTPDALAKQVSASVASKSLIITVTATASDAASAAKIADSTATSLISYVATLDVPVAGSKTPLAMNITHKASVPSAPDSPSRSLTLALALLVGLALGLVIATLRDQVRRRQPPAQPEATLAAALGSVDGLHAAAARTEPSSNVRSTVVGRPGTADDGAEAGEGAGTAPARTPGSPVRVDPSSSRPSSGSSTSPSDETAGSGRGPRS